MLSFAATPLTAGSTVRRNVDWESAHNLFSSALEVVPYNAQVHYEVGKAVQELVRRQLPAMRVIARQDRKVFHFRRAVELNPTYVDALINLGVGMSFQGKKVEALEVGQLARVAHASHALQLYERAQAAMTIMVPKTYALIHENKGRALWSLGRPDEAWRMFGECLRSATRRRAGCRRAQSATRQPAVSGTVHRDRREPGAAAVDVVAGGCAHDMLRRLAKAFSNAAHRQGCRRHQRAGRFGRRMA